MRGRKPKPTHLKLLEGNPGHRPINGAEPKPNPGLPTCPHSSQPLGQGRVETLRPGVAGDGHPDRHQPRCPCRLLPIMGALGRGRAQAQRRPAMIRTPAGYVQLLP